MVKLTRDDVLKLAQLAQIDLSEDEIEKFLKIEKCSCAMKFGDKLHTYRPSILENVSGIAHLHIGLGQNIGLGPRYMAEAKITKTEKKF